MSTTKVVVLCAFCIVLLVPFASFSQVSCTNCTTNNCASVSFSATFQGSVIYTNTSIPWVRGMNVTVAMSNASSSNPLTVQTTQYCPYGSFVTAINGRVAPANSYWTLYINGQMASWGMDYQQVNAGDRITFVCIAYASLKSSKTVAKKSHQLLYMEHAESVKKK
jgi:hypothetical protein